MGPGVTPTSQLLASQEASPRRKGHAEQFKTQLAFATLGFLQPSFLSHWETRGSSCLYANMYLGPTKNSGVLTGPPGPKKETEKDQGLQTGWVFGGLSLMWCHRCGGSPNVFPRFRELTVVCSLRGLAGIMLPVWGSQACERRGNQAQLPLSLRVFCFKVG